MFARYQRNHKSMYLKYDVLGRDLFIELKRDANTNNDVTVPMNLSLKSSMVMNKVEYPKSHKRNVGMKVLII